MSRYISLFYIFLLSSCYQSYSADDYTIPERDMAKVEKMASQGDGKAALRLSLFYLNMKHDLLKSNYWLRLSAEEGNPGGMYLYGLSLSEDKSNDTKQKGEMWLEKAKISDDLTVRALATNALNKMAKENSETQSLP